jgi:SpoVK/Ycf46/Vps4 family AAA+-type ATPase
MVLVEDIALNLRTLLAFSCLPFLYFATEFAFSQRPDVRARVALALTIMGTCLCGFMLLKMSTPVPGGRSDLLILRILHLLPPLLTLLLIHARRGGLVGGVTVHAEGSRSAYAPRPIKLSGEKLGWDDLVVPDSVRGELETVIELLRDPKVAKRYGIEVPKGIMFNGPPGTGKTTIARVIASTARLSFFVLKADEVISKWVGESEKNLSALFEAAQRHAPAVIFIDEIDSIGKGRGQSASSHGDNLLNHLLQLIDGIVKTEGLYVIGATNRSDIVDPALKRAGRLNKSIEIALPDFPARAGLFELYLRKLTLEAGVDLEVLARVTEGKSCADIKEICNQAGLNAFRRESGSVARAYSVTAEDLETALREWVPDKAA